MTTPTVTPPDLRDFITTMLDDAIRGREEIRAGRCAPCGISPADHDAACAEDEVRIKMYSVLAWSVEDKAGDLALAMLAGKLPEAAASMAPSHDGIASRAGDLIRLASVEQEWAYDAERRYSLHRAWLDATAGLEQYCQLRDRTHADPGTLRQAAENTLGAAQRLAHLTGVIPS